MLFEPLVFQDSMVAKDGAKHLSLSNFVMGFSSIHLMGQQQTCEVMSLEILVPLQVPDFRRDRIAFAIISFAIQAIRKIISVVSLA